MTGFNIYYSTAAVTQTEEGRFFGEQTIKVLEKHGTVLTKHLVRPDLRTWERENELNGVNICDRDFGWGVDSDVFVMNATWPMTGGGVEALFSLGVVGIPSLVVHQEGVRISPMISQLRHPLLTKKEYQEITDLEQTIDAYFAQMKQDCRAHPNFIMFDAIDGAGKGAIYEALVDWGKQNGLRMFDCVEYWKRVNHIPTWDEVNKIVGGCQFLLTAEPTYAGMGKIIREEIIRKENPRPYSALSTAHAYALDREILDKLLVLDAIESGALVAKDRGFTTSEHYQPVQAELFDGYSREYFLGVVRGLPGNQYARKHMPGLLILPQIKASIAISRLKARDDKKDNVRFEIPKFQEAIADVYASGRIKSSYIRKGTKVVDLDVNKCPTREDTKRAALEIWNAYLREKDIKF